MFLCQGIRASLGLLGTRQTSFLGKGQLDCDLGGHEEVIVNTIITTSFEGMNLGRYVLGLVEGGKMDFYLFHALVKQSPEERVEYLRTILFETVIPRFEKGECKDEILLLSHLNAFECAVRDKHVQVLGWDAVAFDRDWARWCREIYRLVSPHILCDSKVSNALLSVNVHWWFHTTDDEEAKEIFDFLIEATRQGDVDDVIQGMVRSELYDPVASLERLGEALASLGENRWVFAHRLTKAISARWQRLLAPYQVIFLAEITQQLRGQPSSAEQVAVLDQVGKVVELGDVARRAIELLQNDELIRQLCWEIKEIDCPERNVVIATEFRSGGHYDSTFLNISYSPAVLDYVISILLKSVDLDLKMLKVSVTFDGKEEIRPVL